MVRELISTRGTDGESVPLREAILRSQPDDRGLYTFSEFPAIDTVELASFKNLSYPGLATALLGKFDFGIPAEQLAQIIDDAYGQQWDTKEITPVTDIGDKRYLLELYHGPTQAFKDVALQFLPRILSAYRRPNETLRALGASSGDTISAAHFGAGDVDGLQSIFLLPKNGPSEIQRLQATSHGFGNAITILIDGDFDDGQRIIKEILTNPKYAEMKRGNNFTTFNSINIARILAQIVYYFYAYLRLLSRGVIEIGNPVNFSIPSGNFGDALAGVYARKMGLPIGKLNIATNANDVLHQFLTTGKYTPGTRLIRTLAPSQDITVASNFERMIFEAVNDPKRVVELMQDLNEQGYFAVTPGELNIFTEILTSSTTSDAQIDETIIEVYQERQLIIDPHTATGVHGGNQVFGKKPLIPTIYLATADHIKFDQPAGIPRDEARYKQVVDPLLKHPEYCLHAPVDEASVVAKITEAINILNDRTSKIERFREMDQTAIITDIQLNNPADRP